MSRSGAARACALVALTAALASACGSQESASNTTTTTAVTAMSPSTTASTAAANTSTTTTTTTTANTAAAAPGAIEVAYAGGQVTGGVRTETVRLGDKVRLRVTSDVAEEVHVHTYDVVADVAPGGTAELEFTATIPGRHEVEVEKKGKRILVIEVR